MTIDHVINTDYSNQVTGFTKLFQSIVHSTVWQEEMHVKVVWVTMLALADRNGCVNASEPGLAKAAGVSLEQCLDALARFQAPDPYSRTKAHEGRRIQPIDGGWFMINHPKYRELASKDERRLKVREHVSNMRRRNQVKSDVISGNQSVISSNQSNHKQKQRHEAEAEAEAKTETETKAPLRGRASSPSWLTPYLTAYRETAGEPVMGLLAKVMKPVQDAVGPEQALQVLRTFLESQAVRFGLNYFGQHWREYNPEKLALENGDLNPKAMEQAKRLGLLS